MTLNTLFIPIYLNLIKYKTKRHLFLTFKNNFPAFIKMKLILSLTLKNQLQKVFDPSFIVASAPYFYKLLTNIHCNKLLGILQPIKWAIHLSKWVQ